MSTDFRALCAELIEELNAATNHDDLAIRAGDVIARAHRALAEPFRPAPMAKGGRALQLVLAVGADCAGGAHLSTEQCRLAFDLLAKAYPGTVAPVPLIEPADGPAAVTEQPSYEELRDLWSWAAGQDQGPWPTQYHCFAHALLARWGRHAAPVPVSDRPWQRQGWCDMDGECWWCPPDGPAYWSMVNPAMVYGGWLLPHWAIHQPPQGEEVEESCTYAPRTVCLPAHALPLPAPQGGEVEP